MQLKAGDVITTVGGMRAIPLGAMVRDEFGQHKWDAGYAGAFAESRREDDEPTGWSCTIVSLPTGYDDPAPLQVGDIVKTEADVRRIPDGARVAWEKETVRTGVNPWRWKVAFGMTEEHVRVVLGSIAVAGGLRILALPPGEAPALEPPPRPGCEHCVSGDSCAEVCRALHEVEQAPPPPRCAPGCTPAAPCRTKDVCPVWREAKALLWQQRGIPSDIPAAREMRRPPLRHEGIGGFGNWNGRAPK